MPKSVFGRGSAPYPAGGAQDAPQPPSRLGRGHPSPYLTPLRTNLPSALAMRPPEFQPDLRLCSQRWNVGIGTFRSEGFLPKAKLSMRRDSFNRLLLFQNDGSERIAFNGTSAHIHCCRNITERWLDVNDNGTMAVKMKTSTIRNISTTFIGSLALTRASHYGSASCSIILDDMIDHACLILSHLSHCLHSILTIKS